MTRALSQVSSLSRFVLPLLCGGLILAGCAAAENTGDESRSCSRISNEEAASIQSAVQNVVGTSKELIAFQAFRAAHKDALAAVNAQTLFKKYVWKNGGWEFDSATTGVTNFVFEEGSILAVDVAGEEGVSLHLTTLAFTYTLSAIAKAGYPTGEVKSASLGEWGAGKGVSAEAFGSREKLFLRFPGGTWDETHDNTGGTLALTYALPHIQAKIWEKNAGSTDTLDVSLNGVYRCASEEAVLKSMFPDVWTLLKLY